MKVHLISTIAGSICLATTLAQDAPVFVRVNGTQLAGKGFVRNGTTYVPLKDIGMAIGAKISFDGATASLDLAGVIIPPGDFAKEPYAWTVPEAEKWLAETSAWLDKFGPYLSLVDIDRLEYTSVYSDDQDLDKRRTTQLRASLRIAKQYYDYLGTAVPNRLLLRDWTRLRQMDAIYDALDSTLEFDSSLREAALSSRPPKGLPSHEHLLKLGELALDGHELQLRLQPHVHAIKTWYDRYPPPHVPVR